MGENDVRENQMDFQYLGPKDNVESMEAYEKALDYAFSNPKVKNIAVTGSYGAGKSSIIETYKKSKCCGSRFLHISLTNFEEKETSVKEKETGAKEKETELESQIINQLAHKIGSENLKDSHITMRKRPEWYAVFGWSIFIMALLCCSLYLMNYVSLTELETTDHVLSSIIEKLTARKVFKTVLITEILCVFFSIYYIVNAQIKHHFFRKICIKDSEIQLFQDEKTESVFDRYIDEIKYMLLEADEDIIVFEDIDRYDTMLIFQKLREINMICNHNSDKEIRFVYLLRDDLFRQKDRTKFFDFIIPVLPVVNNSNSGDYFLKFFKGTELAEERIFLKQLSYYVDEMRLVKNICNEYLIYESNLQKISVEKTKKKIFSLVVYKNVFPADYILAQNNRGFVSEIFRIKEQCAELKAEAIDRQIEKLENKIVGEKKELENECLENEEEVNALFFPIDELYRYNGKSEKDYSDRIEFVNDLINHPKEVRMLHSYDRNRYINAGDKVSRAIEIMKQNDQYQEHIRRIEEKKERWESKQKEYLEQIHQLEEDKQNLSKLTVQQYIKKYGYLELYQSVHSQKEDLFNSIDSSEYRGLIQFLLTTGGIDESYQDLVAAFSGKDVSQGDKRYIRAVLDQVKLPYDYKIDNAGAVLESLSEDNLMQENALNMELLAYMVVHKEEKMCNAMFDGIVNNKRYDFIEQFSKANIVSKKIWVPEFAERNPQFVMEGLTVTNVTEELQLLVAATVLYTDSDKMKRKMEQIQQDIFEETFRDDTSFEKVMKNDLLSKKERKYAVAHMVKFYQNYHIQNEYFEIPVNRKSEIFDAIYKNNLYKINKKMLDQILQKKYKLEMENKGYLDLLGETDKIEKETSHVHAYVLENLDEFLDMISQEKIMFTDQPDRLSELIGLADVNWMGMICERMEKQIVHLDGITDIDKINYIIEKRKLAFTTENILKYYMLWYDENEKSSDEEIDDMLIRYMNDFPTEKIQFTFIQYTVLKLNEERLNRLFDKIEQDDTLSNEKYESFLLSLHRMWSTGLNRNIPEKRIPVLISSGIIKMTGKVLNAMRENYPEYVKLYIEKNVKKYIEEVITEDNFDLEECITAIRCDVPDELKIRLLSYTSEPISIQNEKYSEELVLYLLENNYNAEDEDYLLAKDYQKNEIQDFKEKFAVDNIEEIVENRKRLSEDLYLRLIKNESIMYTDEEKKILLADHLDLLSREKVIKIFQMYKWDKYLSILNGKNPTIEATAGDKILLNSMQNEGYVSSFGEDKLKPGYYRVYSKKAQRKMTK